MNARDVAAYLRYRVAPASCANKPQEPGAPSPCDWILDLFRCRTPPPITIDAYAARLLGFCEQNEDGSVATGTLACILLERFAGNLARLSQQQDCGDEDSVTPLTVHRLYLTSLLVALKFLSDRPPAALGEEPKMLLRVMSVLGGVSAHELCQLELAFLSVLEFNLVVSPNEYSSFCVLNCLG
eukprot:TRINITY_DN392_c1_g1_i2.p2 TRINITY_DN392_c1_g1~~TRINITY_DN392_c1_g1_i2.p2  ORF type:complete len:199 (-),score=58.11 TRINITY_DN392_c1_g1_i2:88-636(-)